MNARGARTEHFHRAVDHGLSLIAAGVGRSTIVALANAYSRHGLADAAEGYTYLVLRMTCGGLA